MNIQSCMHPIKQFHKSNWKPTLFITRWWRGNKELNCWPIGAWKSHAGLSVYTVGIPLAKWGWIPALDQWVLSPVNTNSLFPAGPSFLTRATGPVRDHSRPEAQFGCPLSFWVPNNITIIWQIPSNLECISWRIRHMGQWQIKVSMNRHENKKSIKTSWQSN